MSGHTIVLSDMPSRETAKLLVGAAPAGSVMRIRPPGRTLPQNDKMHAMMPGGRVLTSDQWKCLFMDAVARETKNASFASRWEPSLDGDGVVNLGHRSSRLSKDEMGELISFIDAWGTENGVIWSDPGHEEAA
jgi:hypothetical protein